MAKKIRAKILNWIDRIRKEVVGEKKFEKIVEQLSSIKERIL